MKNKHLALVFKILGVILILCALSLVIYNVGIDYFSGKNVEKILEKLEEDKKKINQLSDKNNINDMATVNIDNKEYIGIITMPSVNIKLPVMKKYSNDNIKIAPALYKGNIYQNNAIIAAHNYVSQFKRIQNLKLGDYVIFEDIKGQIFNYKVIKKERISKKDKKIMESGEWDLTLFTCTTSSGYFRATIRLKLLSE